jgi:hypothetical protein
MKKRSLFVDPSSGGRSHPAINHEPNAQQVGYKDRMGYHHQYHYPDEYHGIQHPDYSSSTPQRDAGNDDSSIKRHKGVHGLRYWTENQYLPGRYLPLLYDDQLLVIPFDDIHDICDNQEKTKSILAALGKAIQFYATKPYDKDTMNEHVDFLLHAIALLCIIDAKFENEDARDIQPAELINVEDVAQHVAQYVSIAQVKHMLGVEYTTAQELLVCNKDSHAWYIEQRKRAMKADRFYYCNKSGELVPKPIQHNKHYFRDHLIFLWNVEVWFTPPQGGGGAIHHPYAERSCLKTKYRIQNIIPSAFTMIFIPVNVSWQTI